MSVRTANCRSCDAAIVWMVTATGRRMPVDADTVDEADLEFVGGAPLFDQQLGHVSHFSTCPDHDKWRRK